jgi:transcriptional regulator with XRE-family HTH domain
VEPRERFSVNLRELREAAGMTQMELSDASGLHLTEISRLEQGRRDPRLTTLVRLAVGLGVSPAALLAGIS